MKKYFIIVIFIIVFWKVLEVSYKNMYWKMEGSI